MDMNVSVDDRGNGAHGWLRARLCVTPDSMPGVLPRASIAPEVRSLVLDPVELRLQLLERGDELFRCVGLVVLRELIKLVDPLAEMLGQSELDQQSVDSHDGLLGADIIPELTARAYRNQGRQQ